MTTSPEPPSNRASTTASAAPGRTNMASARPPVSNSTASTTSVLPAPVSPVSAVIPGPNTRLRSSITPSWLTLSSLNIPGP